jgi:hypothetical protein
MRQAQYWKTLPYQWILPAVFFCIGLIYLYVTPHFETPDSITHVAMIRWVAEHDGNLPIQSPGHGQLYGQQASQPPLYYFLMMPVWSAFDTSDFEDFLYFNDLAISGNPSRLGNRNLVFYEQPHPPDLSGTSLAIYVMRLLTLGMSTITVFAVYQSARVVQPERVGLAVMATVLVAFNPQFLFIGTSVNNDNLVTMLATIITWQMLVMLREGFEPRRSVMLAVLIALSTLAKLNGLVMVLMVALAGLWVARRDRNLRGLVLLGGSMLGIWLTMSSWWYVRNIQLYGELFGTGAMIANYGRRDATVMSLLTNEWTGFRQSYWGLFGWFSIFTDALHYRIMDGLTLLSVGGLVVYGVQSRKNPRQLTLFSFLGVMVTVGMVMLVWWTSQTTGSQGRLIFPYIVALSLLMAMGLTALRIPPWLIALPMGLFAVYVPFAYILPAYDQPAVVEQLPETAQDAQITWDDITLLGYELAQTGIRFNPDDEIPITLYWQATAQSPEPLAYFVSLIDMDGNALATIDTFPGWGTTLPTWWQPDTIYRDDLVLQLLDEPDGFSSVQLQIGWYHYPQGGNIRPVDAGGQELATFTIPIGVYVGGDTGQVIKSRFTEDGTVFGDAVRLNAYRFADGNQLRLEWEIVQPLAGDWRVFAFVLESPYADGDDFAPILQKDTAPRVPLGFLEVGDIIRTNHTFDLSEGFAGTYPVYIGWYNADTQERLSVPYPANMMPIADLEFDATID